MASSWSTVVCDRHWQRGLAFSASSRRNWVQSFFLEEKPKWKKDKALAADWPAMALLHASGRMEVNRQVRDQARLG